jgi:hypothetical protein
VNCGICIDVDVYVDKKIGVKYGIIIW